jgi:hypothetical protein
VREQWLLGKVLLIVDGLDTGTPSWADDLKIIDSVNSRARRLGASSKWRVADDPVSKEFQRVFLGAGPTVPAGLESKPKKVGPFGMEYGEWYTDPF